MDGDEEEIDGVSGLHRFANPNRFLRLSKAVFPWSTGLAAVTIAVGLWYAFFVSPADYQQGETVRIMYVHVPSAWMALFVYTMMAVALAAAPVGAGFTVICLATGSLWGKPMWGTWWVWDARLTSVLILFFLYLGFIALANAFDNPARGERAAAILALVGVVNVPIIKFSVDWWNTLHQPASVTKLGMPSIHVSMLIPMLLMAVGFTALFVSLLIIRVRAELLTRRIRALRLADVHAQGVGAVAEG